MQSSPEDSIALRLDMHPEAVKATYGTDRKSEAPAA